MIKEKRACGRPKGKVKTAKIEIAIEPEIKREFMKYLQLDGKRASSEICQWIRNYINDKKNQK